MQKSVVWKFIELLPYNNVRCEEKSGQLYMNFVGETHFMYIVHVYCSVIVLRCKHVLNHLKLKG